jgi:hypothetical protein
MFRSRFPFIAAISMAGLLAAAPLAGQVAYAAANGHTSILPMRHGFFSLDFAEAKVGLTFLKDVQLGCRVNGCNSDRLNLAIFTTAAARKGQHDLFSRLDFVPGFDVGARLAYVASGTAEAHHAAFLGVRLTGHERDLFGFDPVTSVVTLSEEYQRTLAVTIGYNLAFSDATILGIGAEGRREFSSPGADQAREYCTPGTSPSGLRGLVCADRFRAPLNDLWTAHLRADMSFGIADIGAGRAKLAMISAASVDLVQDTTVGVNVALGPSIMIADHPGQPVLVLLLGLRDASRAHALPLSDEQRGSYFSDHVVLGLTVSAPFDVLVGR